jgi:hypothetical protein
MNREELVQLRDAIDLALALPDSVRALLAQWLETTSRSAPARRSAMSEHSGLQARSGGGMRS